MLATFWYLNDVQFHGHAIYLNYTMNLLFQLASVNQQTV